MAKAPGVGPTWEGKYYFKGINNGRAPFLDQDIDLLILIPDCGIMASHFQLETSIWYRWGFSSLISAFDILQTDLRASVDCRGIKARGENQL